MIGIIAITVISISLILFYTNTENPSKNDIKSTNYFADNVTRSAIMNVNKKQSDATYGLSASMLIQLDVIGKTDVIHIYPMIAPWGNDTISTVVLEDKNHASIKVKSGCSYDCGTFQTIIALPKCINEQAEIIGSMRIADYPILSNLDHTYYQIFAKYALPDILPENGKYHIKFVSPYYVKINLPTESVVLSNHTATCKVALDSNKRLAFAADVTFELR